MFESCDEAARRALFFARFESLRLGAPSLEAEHLLLALIREPRGHVKDLLLRLPLTSIREEVESRRSGEEIDSFGEVPFGASAKRVLSCAFDEADRLGYRHVSPEHLLLGILRNRDSLAATVLAGHGMRLEDAREQVRESYVSASTHQSPLDAQLDYVMQSARQVEVLLGMENVTANIVKVQVGILMVALDALKSLLEQQ